jgi:hypothetical protein
VEAKLRLFYGAPAFFDGFGFSTTNLFNFDPDKVYDQEGGSLIMELAQAPVVP